MLCLPRKRKASPDWLAKQNRNRRRRNSVELEIPEEEHSDFNPSTEDEDEDEYDFGLIHNTDLTGSASRRKRASNHASTKHSRKAESRRRRREAALSPEDTEDEETERDAIITRRCERQNPASTTTDTNAVTAESIKAAADTEKRVDSLKKTPAKPPAKSPKKIPVNDQKPSPRKEQKEREHVETGRKELLRQGRVRYMDSRIVCVCHTCAAHRKQAFDISRKRDQEKPRGPGSRS